MADEFENDSNLDEEIIVPDKGKKGGIVRKALIVFTMLTIQCVLAYILLTKIALPKLLPSGEASKAENKQVSEIMQDMDTSETMQLWDEEPEVDERETSVYIISDLVVNPSGSQGKRFLVVSLALMITGGRGADEIEIREPAITDGINLLLSRKTVNWLTEVNNREIIRHEMKLIVNRILTETQVAKVYFTKYVIQ